MPIVVTGNWVNFVIWCGRVTKDRHLRNDFVPNKQIVWVRDDLIVNSYLCLDGHPSYHNSYSYRRTPKLSKQIAEFLAF